MTRQGGRFARSALVIATLLIADAATGGEIVTCEPSGLARDRQPQGHWSWRVVDGRQCWYHGSRGKPKRELRWPDQPSEKASEAEPQVRPVAVQPGGADPTPPSVAAPVNTTPASLTETRALTVDDLLAFTCCWPIYELTPLPRSRPRPTWPKTPPLWLYALVPTALLAGAGLAYILRRES